MTDEEERFAENLVEQLSSLDCDFEFNCYARRYNSMKCYFLVIDLVHTELYITTPRICTVYLQENAWVAPTEERFEYADPEFPNNLMEHVKSIINRGLTISGQQA